MESKSSSYGCKVRYVSVSVYEGFQRHLPYISYLLIIIFIYNPTFSLGMKVDCNYHKREFIIHCDTSLNIATIIVITASVLVLIHMAISARSGHFIWMKVNEQPAPVLKCQPMDYSSSEPRTTKTLSHI